MIFNRPAPRPRHNRSEGEKPFWISFADLMTALMVLLLVALTVALLAITHEISASERQKAERQEAIDRFLKEVAAATEDFPGVRIRGQVIDFGDRARFDTNSHRLNDSQARLLREFVPKVLDLARRPEGERWLKRIVVEGFADQRGAYLYNLNLSLQRSERVLCALLAAPAGGNGLGDQERRMVKELFLVSGSSFNALKASAEESRRIELRLEFRDLAEGRPSPRPDSAPADQRCPLDPA